MSVCQLADFTLYLKQLGLDDSLMATATGQATLLRLDAGEVLLHQGCRQKFAYFISAGLLKACHYNDNGAPLVKEFYFEQELCFLYSSWLTGEVAQYQIEVMQEANVVRLPLTLLDDRRWHKVKINLLSQQLIYKEQKEAFLLLHTPEQRYLHLLKHRPMWVDRLNNQQLAYYIGISPVSLSRLKARLANGLYVAAR